MPRTLALRSYTGDPRIIALMRDTKLVWTSDPEQARRLRESSGARADDDSAPSAQTIRVAIDKKRRAGKSVTVASGFHLSPASLSHLASQLKRKCGSGGTAKEAEIEIQGDHIDAVANELTAMGYRVRR